MPIIEQFGRKHFSDLFFTHLRSGLPAIEDYLSFVCEFLVRIDLVLILHVLLCWLSVCFTRLY